MSRHDDRIRLRHMLDHAAEAVEMARGRSANDIANNRMLELALVRLVEIVGEAAARVTKQTRDKCPGIPWLQIVGMRNRLVHAYDSVDHKVLWDTLTDDLPALVAALEGALDSIDTHENQ